MLVGLADDMLLPADKAGDFAEALKGLAALTAGQLENIFSKRAHLQEIDFGGVGAVLLGMRFGVVGEQVPIRQVQFVEEKSWVISSVARFGRLRQIMRCFATSVNGGKPRYFLDILVGCGLNLEWNDINFRDAEIGARVGDAHLSPRGSLFQCVGGWRKRKIGRLLGDARCRTR